jgi:hypothetical protein
VRIGVVQKKKKNFKKCHIAYFSDGSHLLRASNKKVGFLLNKKTFEKIFLGKVFL